LAFGFWLLAIGYWLLAFSRLLAFLFIFDFHVTKIFIFAAWKLICINLENNI